MLPYVTNYVLKAKALETESNFGKGTHILTCTHILLRCAYMYQLTVPQWIQSYKVIYSVEVNFLSKYEEIKSSPKLVLLIVSDNISSTSVICICTY